MKKIIAANWKSNKSKDEASQWLDDFSKNKFENSLEVIIFPPFTLLDFVSSYVKEKKLPLKVGAQNVSPYGPGAYTGEVNALQIKEFASYVLIGHSERRTNFQESNDMVNKKIDRAQASGIVPIVCVSNLEQVRSLTQRDLLIAYEPIEAIGTGSPKEPAIVEGISRQIKEISEGFQILYGGSVDAQNIKNYTSLLNIEGALVGGESLDVSSFSEILNNAV